MNTRLRSTVSVDRPHAIAPYALAQRKLDEVYRVRDPCARDAVHGDVALSFAVNAAPNAAGSNHLDDAVIY
jgi:hypothetical protein